MNILMYTRINRLQFAILYLISIFCLYVGNRMLSQGSEFPEITANVCMVFGVALYTLALIFRANDIGYNNMSKLAFWFLSGIPLLGLISVGALLYLPSDNLHDTRHELKCSDALIKLSMKLKGSLYLQDNEYKSNYGEAIYSFCMQYEQIQCIIQKYNFSKDEFQNKLLCLEHNHISWQGDIYLPLIVSSSPRLLEIMCAHSDGGVSYFQRYFSNTTILDGKGRVYHCASGYGLSASDKVAKNKICGLVLCLLSIISLTLFVPYKVDTPIQRYSSINGRVMYGTIANMPEKIIAKGAEPYTQIDYGRVLLNEGIIIVLVAAGYFGSSMIKK